MGPSSLRAASWESSFMDGLMSWSTKASETKPPGHAITSAANVRPGAMLIGARR